VNLEILVSKNIPPSSQSRKTSYRISQHIDKSDGGGDDDDDEDGGENDDDY
jgi:hypothetical protein